MAGASLVSQCQLFANNGHSTVSGTHRVRGMSKLQAGVKAAATLLTPDKSIVCGHKPSSSPGVRGLCHGPDLGVFAHHAAVLPEHSAAGWILLWVLLSLLPSLS